VRSAALLGGGTIAAALLLVLPAFATADSRRVAISNYSWSNEVVEIDLDEHVTWHWIGPDTMHSVTGQAPPAAGLDSDPQTNQPKHAIGDDFRLDFDQPGTYEFQCKLHSTVSGTVVVSDAPGNPNSEPDPIPQSLVDLEPPNLRDIRLQSTKFGRRGTAMRYSINEPARIEIEYFRLKRKGGRKFAGYARHKGGTIGFNGVRFGVERANFGARPGRYLAKVAAIDRSANRTRETKLSFRIFRGRG
jgi:plastocyanin